MEEGDGSLAAGTILDFGSTMLRRGAGSVIPLVPGCPPKAGWRPATLPGGRLARSGAVPNAWRKPAMVAATWAVRKMSPRCEALKSRKEVLGSVGWAVRPRWGEKDEDEAVFIMSFTFRTMGGREAVVRGEARG